MHRDHEDDDGGVSLADDGDLSTVTTFSGDYDRPVRLAGG
jgi:hypothetical protein